MERILRSIFFHGLLLLKITFALPPKTTTFLCITHLMSVLLFQILISCTQATNTTLCIPFFMYSFLYKIAHFCKKCAIILPFLCISNTYENMQDLPPYILCQAICGTKWDEHGPMGMDQFFWSGLP